MPPHERQLAQSGEKSRRPTRGGREPLLGSRRFCRTTTAHVGQRRGARHGANEGGDDEDTQLLQGGMVACRQGVVRGGRWCVAEPYGAGERRQRGQRGAASGAEASRQAAGGGGRRASRAGLVGRRRCLPGAPRALARAHRARGRAASAGARCAAGPRGCRIARTRHSARAPRARARRRRAAAGWSATHRAAGRLSGGR